MAKSTKSQIDVNKLDVGTAAITDAKMGTDNVKYMSMGTTTVFDRVNYEFDVDGSVQYHSSAGGSMNITNDATVTSSKTHGNGSVDSVSYSPTSVSWSANTGGSYTTSQTITQSGSGLTKTFTWGVSKPCSCNNSYSYCSCYGDSGCSCNGCYSQGSCSCNSCNTHSSYTIHGTCSCNVNTYCGSNGSCTCNSGNVANWRCDCNSDNYCSTNGTCSCNTNTP